jgi:hypothetical protein
MLVILFFWNINIDKTYTMKMTNAVVLSCYVIIAVILFLGSPLSCHVPMSRYTFCEGDLYS